MDAVTSKVCNRCGEDKPLEQFHKAKTGKYGRHPKCAKCKNKAAEGYYQRWTTEQRLAHRERVHRTRYGVTAEFVTDLFELQEGCCAICGKAGEKPAVGEKGRRANVLHIDHDHESGKVRALLCLNCNVGLGRFKDNTSLLLAAAIYIEKYKED